MPVCGACGREMATRYCSFCGTLGEPEPIPPNASPATVIPAGAPRDRYFQRTPFQLAILTFATFGAYYIYWIIRARRFAERRLEREVTPYSYYWRLLIPIWGLIVFFESFSTASRRVNAAGVRPAVPFWLCALGVLALGLLWRLPGSYYILCLLDGIAMLPAYAVFARAERVEAPAASWARFTVAEWIISIAGGAVALFAFLGSAVEVSAAEAYTVLGVAGAWLAAFIATWVQARGLRPVTAERRTPSA